MTSHEARRTRAFFAAALLAAGIALPGCSTGPLAALGPRNDAAALLDRYREQGERRRADAEAADAAARAQQAGPSLEEMLSQGDHYRDVGDLSAALLAYARAHRVAGDRTEVTERIAFLHLREEPERAEAIFEMLLAEGTPRAPLLTGLALARLAQGRFEEARESLVQAVVLDPDAATPRCLLGVIHDRLGDHDAAQVQYQEAQSLRPDDYVILNNWGASQILTRDFEAAVANLRKATALEPRDAALRNNLGIALGMLGRHEIAFEEFARAAGKAEAHNNLGWVLYLQGDYARAVDHFEKALAVRGESLLTVVRNIELAQAALERAGEPIETPEAFDGGESSDAGESFDAGDEDEAVSP